MIPLSKLQKEIMQEFYDIAPTKVVFNKEERQAMWKQAVAGNKIADIETVKELCPALAHRIEKSEDSGRNIQSAVFSECVYAQTFANMLNLDQFKNCMDDESFLPEPIKKLLASYHLYPRYAYFNEDQSRILIQAGGCNGIDSALITVIDLNIYTIEFKERGAKTSEPDLPKYKEDGRLRITEDFLRKYPQFKYMVEEHIGLNFFEVMGSNVHNFSAESVNIAVTNNYTKKYADVVCTEDTDGTLVMIPANQISEWANLEGEIRPAGRNAYKVWTPKALQRFLEDMGASFDGGMVTVEKAKLAERRPRGGTGISGYKINPLFFVRIRDCEENGNRITFAINKVKQLKPTVAGKMFFKDAKYDDIKKHYFG